MTKRAKGKFARNPRDLYDTPESAVLPLLPHIKGNIRGYIEPCVGNSALVKALTVKHEIPVFAMHDISIDGTDATTASYPDTVLSGMRFITNPPWQRQLKGVPSHEQPLHAIIENLRKQAPTWLLFDADWMHTKQAIPYLKHCRKIVSVGRVSWMQNDTVGFDNCCWYLFGDGEYDTTFYSRI